MKIFLVLLVLKHKPNLKALRMMLMQLVTIKMNWKVEKIMSKWHYVEMMEMVQAKQRAVIIKIIIIIYNNSNGNSNDFIFNKEVSKWSMEEVLEWIKMILINEGLNVSNVINPFLNEFSSKNITGKMLLRFENDIDSNDNSMIEQFGKEFSKENQSFGVWMTIKSEIKNLNNNSNIIENVNASFCVVCFVL